eukprot:TRINITY_DN14061_c0_g2_i2.p1 TRINITY_DN14061_c0_g2~~TRINITY_DN14061_c0_g2_i2.p1  ORF type:complete len:191 (-),score=29.61 TRINITY_DN14061_c0_g2_i2:468-989(-)
MSHEMQVMYRGAQEAEQRQAEDVGIGVGMQRGHGLGGRGGYPRAAATASHAEARQQQFGNIPGSHWLVHNPSIPTQLSPQYVNSHASDAIGSTYATDYQGQVGAGVGVGQAQATGVYEAGDISLRHGRGVHAHDDDAVSHGNPDLNLFPVPNWLDPTLDSHLQDSPGHSSPRL